MKFIENIKKKIGHRILEKKLKNKEQEIVVCNMQKARSIGIIFNATYQMNFEIVRNFIKNHIPKNADVSVLGYIDSQEVIDQYLYRKGYEFMTKGDMNSFYIPKQNVIESFVSKQFDILLNLSLEYFLPIKYVIGLSDAKFKVGRYSHDEKYLHLMIKVDEDDDEEGTEETRVADNAEDDEGDKESAINRKLKYEIRLNMLVNHLSHYLNAINNVTV